MSDQSHQLVPDNNWRTLAEAQAEADRRNELLGKKVWVPGRHRNNHLFYLSDADSDFDPDRGFLRSVD
jgi:hypothetical protein